MKRCLRVCFSAVIVLGVHAGQAQQKLPEDASLDGVKLEYDIARSELAKPIRDLQGSYKSQLEKLRDEMKGAGNLDKTLAVNTELEGFRQGTTKPAGRDFPELRQLQSIYAREASQRYALASRNLPVLVKAHKDRLELLQKQLTRQGKFEEAANAKEAIANVDETLGIIVPRPGESAPAVVEWTGELESFEIGALQFSNRGYVWTDVPRKFKDWKMSMQAGGSQRDSEINVKTRGLVYAVIDPAAEEDFQENGWKTIEVLLGGNGGKQEYKLVEKAFESGKHTLSGKGWFTTRILLPPSSVE